MFGFIEGGIEVDFGLAEDGALGGYGIVTIDGGGRDEAGKGVKSFFVFAFAAEARGCADAGQIDVVEERAVEIVDADFGAGVFQISEKKRIVHYV